MDAGSSLRNRLSGGGVPAVAPDVLSFLAQAAAAAPVASTSTPAGLTAAPKASGATPKAAPAAEKPAEKKSGFANAPWNKPKPVTEEKKPTTYSKAGPPEKPNAPQEGAKSEDLAAALSTALLGQKQETPSVELIEALARAAKLKDEEGAKSEAADKTESKKKDAEDSNDSKDDDAPEKEVKDDIPKITLTAFDKLSRDALKAAKEASGGNNAAEAAAKAAIELMKKQLKATEHIVSEKEENKDERPLSDLWNSEDKGGDGNKTPPAPVPVQALPLAARAAAGPSKGAFRYEVAPGDDVEACFRNIRRRIEVEMGDGCSVQMSLQMVR
eukprot:TRINITY_DN82140_c0_g1_i1.p1 TRINITY_DN82140_c0_g1~~TRINITY_DN82140_c0_g1_i1.p1  ORF type:complete len:328 (+),score=111.20 TRINITY_DN82140_c0_g1_i1:72-1055(+)